MADITTSAVREIGQLRDTEGRPVVIGADCDAVTLQAGYGLTVRLDATQRNEFIRRFCEAEWAAEAWAREHAGAGDERPHDLAKPALGKPWCRLDGCVNSGTPHQWHASCRSRAEKDRAGPVS